VRRFQALLLMQDAVIPVRSERTHAMHLEGSASELLHHYRYEWGGGYFESQIRSMVGDGWEEEDAVPVRMLGRLGAVAIAGAINHSDPTLGACCHAVYNGITRRARSSSEVAPLLYMPMQGVGSLGSLGLADRDPSITLLGSTPVRRGAAPPSATYSAPLIMGDDPTLVCSRGIAVFSGSTDR
jgi:hypothetical protein